MRRVYVRVRDPETGHYWSTPEWDPMIAAGVVEVVERIAPHHLPLPPKHKITLPRLSGPIEGDN